MEDLRLVGSTQSRSDSYNIGILGAVEAIHQMESHSFSIGGIGTRATVMETETCVNYQCCLQTSFNWTMHFEVEMWSIYGREDFSKVDMRICFEVGGFGCSVVL